MSNCEDCTRPAPDGRVVCAVCSTRRLRDPCWAHVSYGSETEQLESTVIMAPPADPLDSILSTLTQLDLNRIAEAAYRLGELGIACNFGEIVREVLGVNVRDTDCGDNIAGRDLTEQELEAVSEALREAPVVPETEVGPEPLL